MVWPSLPVLLLARVLSGLGIGAATATAMAWLAELRDGGSGRAQVVATGANLGGLGLGGLIAGVLAQWVGDQLRVPFRGVHRGAAAGVGGARRRAGDACPALAATALPAAACIGAGALPRSVLSRRARRRDHVRGLRAIDLAGAELLGWDTASAIPCAGRRRLVRAVRHRNPRADADGLPHHPAVVAAAIPALLAGLGLLTIAVWLPSPSFGVFLAGDVVVGAGCGLMFKGAIATVSEISAPEHRAEALAGVFPAAYLGLAGPVIGLGALTQIGSTRVSLLVFAGILALGILAATPELLGRGGSHPSFATTTTST
jgi:MFS family permease